MSVLSEMVGRKVISIHGLKEDSEEVIFELNDGWVTMRHCNHCCEDVRICQIDGDPNDLIGEVIVMAEESVSSESHDKEKEGSEEDSYTWTFYRFATVKGYVNVRWLGQSNGYYSERVDLEFHYQLPAWAKYLMQPEVKTPAPPPRPKYF